MNTRSRIEKARAKVEEQKRWIADHGADLSGYVARYGTSGDGGAAIYAADAAQLAKDEAAYLALTGKGST